MISFNEEQQRLLNNLTQYYDAWLGHARRLRAEFTYRLQWKTVAGREYLYKIVDRKGNGTSLGAKSAANEAEFSRYTAAREQVRAGERAAKSKLAVAGSLYRALRLPVIANPAAAILREADLRGMLDGTLLVIGANALAAYELEAGARFAAGLDATEDFDLSWSATALIHCRCKALRGTAYSIFSKPWMTPTPSTPNATFRRAIAAPTRLSCCLPPVLRAALHLEKNYCTVLAVAIVAVGRQAGQSGCLRPRQHVRPHHRAGSARVRTAQALAIATEKPGPLQTRQGSDPRRSSMSLLNLGWKRRYARSWNICAAWIGAPQIRKSRGR